MIQTTMVTAPTATTTATVLAVLGNTLVSPAAAAETLVGVGFWGGWGVGWGGVSGGVCEVH